MKLLAATVLFLLMTTSISFAGVRGLTPAEAKALLSRNHNVFLLDVRTREEYQKAHLHGSVLIPLDELPQKMREVPTNRPIVVYCAVGARSQQAADFLATRGFREIYNIKEGLVGWYKNGYPLER